jgi:hypothetical protein
VAKSFLTTFILFLPVMLAAQFNLNSFLGTARTDMDLEGIYKKLEYLGENKISSPVINQTELRIRTRDLNISPDDYSLRIFPTSPAAVSMNKQYNKIQVNSLNNDLQFALNNALKTRYKLFINYLYYTEKIKLIQDEDRLLSDELKIIKGKGEFETMDIEDLIDTERRIINLQVDETELESKVEKIKITINDLYNFQGDISINLNDLISVARISSLISEISSASDSTNIYLTHAKSKLNIKESKYKVELAESSKNMGFIQTQYSVYRGNNPEATPVSKRLGFEIGIRIPFTNSDKADNQRAYLNLIEDHFDATKKENALTTEQQYSTINLVTSISKYNIINNKLDQLFPGNTFDIYQKHIGKDPDKLLKIKNTQLKLLGSRLELLEETYSNYIDFIDVYGRLSETPLRNYLLPGLDEI